jgi:hypothetical protein
VWGNRFDAEVAMWTDEARALHEPRVDGYPSDLTDGERAMIAPLIPPPRPAGASAKPTCARP